MSVLDLWSYKNKQWFTDGSGHVSIGLVVLQKQASGSLMGSHVSIGLVVLQKHTSSSLMGQVMSALDLWSYKNILVVH